MILGWRVWYDDGSVYDSAEYAWAQVPDDGVLVKLIYYGDGTRQIQQGMDFYYEAPHHSGEPIRGTSNSLDDIADRYPGAVVKAGRWAPDDYYRAVVADALQTPWGI